MPKLVLPSIKYKKSFLKDFLPHMGKSRVKYESLQKFIKSGLIKKDFSGFVKYIRSQSKGQNLPEGYIPHTIFWLVEKDKFMGWLSLRHRLNEHLKHVGGHIGYEIAPKYRGRGFGKLILKLGLKKARLMGINNVLITCDIDNTPSKKVIEANGGREVKKYWLIDKKIYKLRYWIRARNA